MGLLEDAIREHLELKRLRGADPAEVAREQHEALDTPPETGPDAGALHDAPAAYAADDVAHAPDEHTPAAEDPIAAAGEPTTGELTGVGEETAELDVEAMLAQHPPPAGEAGDPPELAQGRIPPAMTDEDSLEWEVPARAHDADGPGPLEDDAGVQAPAGHEPHEGHEGHEGQNERDLAAEDNAPDQGRLSF
ncbi:MAG TPA: hypothetical protein VHY83_09950 [Solirubrobacteraceae bacterium]|jgi:hypothetical protein|nr:hypothetical protein [Solirubrobacteraceae bacterium]